jgi:hypothetical protein
MTRQRRVRCPRVDSLVPSLVSQLSCIRLNFNSSPQHPRRDERSFRRPTCCWTLGRSKAATMGREIVSLFRRLASPRTRLSVFLPPPILVPLNRRLPTSISAPSRSRNSRVHCLSRRTGILADPASSHSQSTQNHRGRLIAGKHRGRPAQSPRLDKRKRLLRPAYARIGSSVWERD